MALDTQSDFTQVALEMSNQEPLAYEGGYGFYGWVSRLEDRMELAIFKDEVFGNGAMYRIAEVEGIAEDKIRASRFDNDQKSMVNLTTQALKLRKVLN